MNKNLTLIDCGKKLVLAAILPVVLAFSSFTSFAQNYMPFAAFQPGERISFTVFYNVMGMYVNAGNATFKTSLEKYNNIPVYHVVAEGATNRKYDWIFKVRDRYESFFDTQDYSSLKFIRNIHEGSFKHSEEVIFNRHNNTAVSANKVYKLPGTIMDVINALYYARNLDYNAYKPGDKITFDMFLDNQVYNMYIRYLGKEEIKTRYGTFKAIKLRPLLLKGSIFDGGEKMTMWVTDDANHIPVRIESPISVGTIKVDLMDYANLKHPLSSLVALK
jgi:hypothetical protein